MKGSGGVSAKRSIDFGDREDSSGASPQARKLIRQQQQNQGKKKVLGPINSEVGRRAHVLPPPFRVQQDEDGMEEPSAFLDACIIPKMNEDTSKNMKAEEISLSNLSASPIAKRQDDIQEQMSANFEEDHFVATSVPPPPAPVGAVVKRGRGRPKGTRNKRRAPDEFVDVEVSHGVVGPLQQERIVEEPGFVPRDVLNYQPLLQREDRTNPRPQRVRVLPLAYWRGEKPIYGVRTREDNVPEVAGYGLVGGLENRAEMDKKKKKKNKKENKRKRNFYNEENY